MDETQKKLLLAGLGVAVVGTGAYLYVRSQDGKKALTGGGFDLGEGEQLSFESLPVMADDDDEQIEGDEEWADVIAEEAVVEDEPLETEGELVLDDTFVYPEPPKAGLPDPDAWPSDSETRRAMILPFIEAARKTWNYSEGWSKFALAASRKESRWNLFAANVSDTESAASKAAYELFFIRNPERTLCCPKSHYTWGSGGWWGLLPMSGIANRVEYRGLDPFPYMFLPEYHTAFFTGFVRSCVRRCLNSYDMKPEQITWLTIRRGMKEMKHMKLPPESDNDSGVKERLTKDLTTLGFSTDVMHMPVSYDIPPDMEDVPLMIMENL